MKQEWLDQLLQEARVASTRAYAPYSKFHVGAALLSDSGTIFSGCNVENASYGLTLCAERVALGAARAAGESQFQALLIFTETKAPTTPCGACRQVIWELAGDIPIMMANSGGVLLTQRTAELLPSAFDRHTLAS